MTLQAVSLAFRKHRKTVFRKAVTEFAENYDTAGLKCFPLCPPDKIECGRASVITIEQLRLYEKFDGNFDGWARLAKPSSSTMTDQAWTQIDVIMHRLRIVVSGQSCDVFCTEALKEARDAAADETVYEHLFKLASSSK
jgi:hypothetical protein